MWNEEALHKFSGDVGCTIFRCKAEDTIKGQPLTLRPSDSVWLCEVQEKAKKKKKKNEKGTYRHHSQDESDGNTKC